MIPRGEDLVRFPEEINKLRWEDLDFHEHTIRVNASAAKTRKERLAKICDKLQPKLLRLKNRTSEAIDFGKLHNSKRWTS
jgi:hypothetical protein